MLPDIDAMIKMQHHHPLRQNMPSVRSVPSAGRKVNRRRHSKTKDVIVSSDDPPDHIEERARRTQNIVSRQRSDSSLGTSSNTRTRSGSTLSTSSSTHHSSSLGSPSHSSRKQSRQNQQFQHVNIIQQNYLVAPPKSISPLESTPIPTTQTSPLPKSHHGVTTIETNSETADNHSNASEPRHRQQSPHPVDILKAQLHNDLSALHDVPNEKQTSAHQQSQSSLGGSSGEIPNFTISNNLESSESAEELRHLIEAMQNEFQRLRLSKINAEVKAQKLQTDLSIQEQEMEKHFESLSMENEHLKSESNEHKIKASHMTGRVKQLESENRKLKVECSKLQRSKDVAEGLAVAAELRATIAEEKNVTTQKTIRELREKKAMQKERRRRSIPSPLKRIEESKKSKPP